MPARALPRPYHVAARLALAVAALSLSCGGAGSDATTLPPRFTRATLVGPLCDADRCQCHNEAGSDAGAPPSSELKRFEVRLGPVENELWVELDGMTFYKGTERAEECFYVDLAPGQHPVVIHGAGDPGFGARMSVAERGQGGWYDTFEFGCGAPGWCDFDGLKEWEQAVLRAPRQLHDPCGSTKIRDAEWKAGGAVDRTHPQHLEVNLVLDVYDFTPQHNPGDPACANK